MCCVLRLTAERESEFITNYFNYYIYFPKRHSDNYDQFVLYQYNKQTSLKISDVYPIHLHEFDGLQYF